MAKATKFKFCIRVDRESITLVVIKNNCTPNGHGHDNVM